MNNVVKQKQICCLVLCCILFVCNGALRAQTFDRSVKTAANFEAAIPHPDQQKHAAKKLKRLHAKTGQRTNIVWIVVDDMGYGDPGLDSTSRSGISSFEFERDDFNVDGTIGEHPCAGVTAAFDELDLRVARQCDEPFL